MSKLERMRQISELERMKEEYRKLKIETFRIHCKNGNKEFVSQFISDMTFENEDLVFGFEDACREGHLEIVKMIFERKIYHYEKDKLSSGLACAIRNKQLGIIDYLSENLWYDFHWCAYELGREGDMKFIKYLITKGFRSWDNCLKGACNAKNIDVMKEMIIRGAEMIYEYQIEDIQLLNKRILFEFINISLPDDIKSIIYLFLKISISKSPSFDNYSGKHWKLNN